MDLSTTYLGLQLPHPIMPGACPMGADLDAVRRLEDGGAAAIVLHSLFEEQITGTQLGAVRHMERHMDAFPEALSYFPARDEFLLGPEEYVEHIRKVKAAVKLPVIASLNGTTRGGWLDYAKRMQEAGADALELNEYALATDPEESASALEQRALDLLRDIKKTVRIPVALKLSPFFTALPHFARQADAAGVDGLILFNRFYQPDIDVEELEVRRELHLSDSTDLLLRLRWLAILSGRVKGSLAVTGGVHTTLDALKAVMTGAHAVQMVSALYLKGPGLIKRVRDEMGQWLEKHEYESLRQAQGSMNLLRCPDPKAYERANYVHVLRSWHE